MAAGAVQQELAKLTLQTEALPMPARALATTIHPDQERAGQEAAEAAWRERSGSEPDAAASRSGAAGTTGREDDEELGEDTSARGPAAMDPRPASINGGGASSSGDDEVTHAMSVTLFPCMCHITDYLCGLRPLWD